MNLRERGMAWHASKSKTGSGVSATIRRRAATQTVTGWLAAVQYEVIDDGVLTLVTLHDWSFAKADVAWMPQRGDEITATINGTARKFTVTAPPNGKPVEHKDSHAFELVVHTDEITCPQS
jgi:hypothetical protein